MAKITTTWFHTPTFTKPGAVVAKLEKEGFRVKTRTVGDEEQVCFLDSLQGGVPHAAFMVATMECEFVEVSGIEAIVKDMLMGAYSALFPEGTTFLDKVEGFLPRVEALGGPNKTTVEEVEIQEEPEVSLVELNELMLEQAMARPSREGLEELVSAMRRCKHSLAQAQLPEFERILEERKAVDKLTEAFEGMFFDRDSDLLEDFKDLLKGPGLQKEAPPAEEALVQLADDKYVSLKEVRAFCAGWISHANAEELIPIEHATRVAVTALQEEGKTFEIGAAARAFFLR